MKELLGTGGGGGKIGLKFMNVPQNTHIYDDLKQQFKNFLLQLFKVRTSKVDFNVVINVT